MKRMCLPPLLPRSRTVGKKYEGADEDTRKAFRIVADHVRCATFHDRRRTRHYPFQCGPGLCAAQAPAPGDPFSGKLGIAGGSLPAIAKVVIDKYAHAYEELRFNEK